MATVFDSELIVIYTMGKVASTSISASLFACGVSCADVHVMSRPALKWCLRDAVNRNTFPPPHVGDALRIRRDFYKKDRNVKVISLVRDCPSRVISLTFQNLKRSVDYSINDISTLLAEKNPLEATDWFTNEFERATRINVFNEPFDVENKYSFYQQPGLDVLMLRVDVDDALKEQLISEFLGKNIRLQRANVSDDKWYSDLYDEFKTTGEIPQLWFDQLKTSRVLKHFYTEQERDEALSKFRHLVKST